MKHIAVIVDSLSWVQAQRAKDLQPYLPDHHLNVVTPKMVEVSGFSSYDAFWLASWRIGLAEPWLLENLPLERTLGSVTSHYQIGGGLNPSSCFRKGTDPAEEFQKSIETLGRFRVITCNSAILHNMLTPHLPMTDVILAQNGVDAEFFSPDVVEDWTFAPHRIFLTSICKRKGAKNVAALEAAVRHLDGWRWFGWQGVVLKKGSTFVMNREAVRETFLNGHFYVCTSWHEGTPNPALEAAACGLPLITTPVGNMPELVKEGETGWFIDPTAESLIACVERLQYLEPFEYRRMSKAIRAEIEANWRWAKRAEAYRKALEVACG